MNYGMKVTIKFCNGHYGNKTEILRNVTEIHYCYEKSTIIIESTGQRIAFESDIQATGCTFPKDNIKEFETSLEETIAEDFYEEFQNE